MATVLDALARALDLALLAGPHSAASSGAVPEALAALPAAVQRAPALAPLLEGARSLTQPGLATPESLLHASVLGQRAVRALAPLAPAGSDPLRALAPRAGLETRGAPELLRELLSVLGNGEARDKARVDALARLRAAGLHADLRALETLLALLGEGKLEERVAGVLLPELGAAVAPELRQRFEESSEERAQAHALWALALAAPEAARDACLAGCSSKRAQVRVAALRGLSLADPAQAEGRARAALEREKVAAVRAAAAYALGDAARERAVDALREEALAGDAWSAALVALSRVDGAEATEALCAVAAPGAAPEPPGSDRMFRRDLAVTLLGGRPEARACEVLRALSEGVQAPALVLPARTALLRQARREGLEHLAGLLFDADPQAVLHALAAHFRLADAGGPSAFERLESSRPSGPAPHEVGVERFTQPLVALFTAQRAAENVAVEVAVPPERTMLPVGRPPHAPFEGVDARGALARDPAWARWVRERLADDQREQKGALALLSYLPPTELREAALELARRERPSTAPTPSELVFAQVLSALFEWREARGATDALALAVAMPQRFEGAAGYGASHTLYRLLWDRGHAGHLPFPPSLRELPAVAMMLTALEPKLARRAVPKSDA